VNYNAIDYNNNYYISKNFTTKMCEREGGRERGREREREREYQGQGMDQGGFKKMARNKMVDGVGEVVGIFIPKKRNKFEFFLVILDSGVC
jgi:hypothetical protein